MRINERISSGDSNRAILHDLQPLSMHKNEALFSSSPRWFIFCSWARASPVGGRYDMSKPAKTALEGVQCR